MNKLTLGLVAMFLISCGSSRVVTTKGEQKDYKPKIVLETSSPEVNAEVDVVTSNPQVDTTPIHTSNKVERYIHQYKNIAIYEMQQHGVPASITLAQGILESGAGAGELTKRANNHFGIKCHDWQGERVYHDDDKKGECFRKYNNPAESFKDHSLFLSGRKRYASLFNLDIKNYKGWAKGLRKAGYATDPRYPSKLIDIIERYNLNQYDSKIKSTVVLPEPAPNKIYTIKQGDSLYSIAKKFNITVDQLKKINNLANNDIKIGQQLTIQ